MILESLPADRV